jgi:uncharacterized membrane protein
MEFWLIIAILAYLFFAISSFGDKLLLSGKTSPISYTFYASLFGLFSLFFLPFSNFKIPPTAILLLIAVVSLIRFVGLFFSYKAVEKFEVSRVVPSIGALQPVLIFLLTWIFWSNATISINGFIAFILLLIGGIVISFEKKIEFKKEYIGLIFLVAFLASLDFILVKIVYTKIDFLNAFILVAFFIAFYALLMLLFKKTRKIILSKQLVLERKNQLTFLFAQISGGLGGIFYNWTISLTPESYLAIVSSLRGVQYVFLFLITLLTSIFLPKFLKESLSKKNIFRKIFGIIIIATGLAILAF